MFPHCPEISDNKHLFVLETHRPVELEEDSGDTKTPIDKTPDQVVVREDPSMVEERPPRVWNSVLCGSNHHQATTTLLPGYAPTFYLICLKPSRWRRGDGSSGGARQAPHSSQVLDLSLRKMRMTNACLLYSETNKSLCLSVCINSLA